MKRVSMSKGVSGAITLLAFLFAAYEGHAFGADGTEDALIKQGVEKRKAGEDAAALDLFQRAYQVRHSPKAAAQMGLAEIAMGNWQGAENHLEEALGAAQDPWIKRNLKALTDALSNVREHLGELDVVGTPEGAEVLIEGEVRGKLPLPKPLRVRTGDCRFEVRRPGFEAIRRTVQISPNELTREAIKLVPVATAPPAIPPVQPAPAAAAPPKGAPTVATTQMSPAASDAPRNPRGARIASFVLLGAGVVAVTSGVVFYRMASAKLDGINADADSSPPRPYDPANGNWKTFDRLGIAAVAVGAAGLVGGAALFFATEPPNRPASRESTVSFGLSPNGRPVVSVAGTF